MVERQNQKWQKGKTRNGRKAKPEMVKRQNQKTGNIFFEVSIEAADQ